MTQKLKFDDIEIGDYVIHNSNTSDFWTEGKKYEVFGIKPDNNELLLIDNFGVKDWTLFCEFDIEKKSKFQNMKFRTPTQGILSDTLTALDSLGYKWVYSGRELGMLPRFEYIVTHSDGRITWSGADCFESREYKEFFVTKETKYTITLSPDALVEFNGKKYKQGELEEVLSKLKTY